MGPTLGSLQTGTEPLACQGSFPAGVGRAGCPREQLTANEDRSVQVGDHRQGPASRLGIPRISPRPVTDQAAVWPLTAHLSLAQYPKGLEMMTLPFPAPLKVGVARTNTLM